MRSIPWHVLAPWIVIAGLVPLGGWLASRLPRPDLAAAEECLARGDLQETLRIALDQLERRPADQRAARLAGIAFCRRNDPVLGATFLLEQAGDLVRPEDLTELAGAELRTGEKAATESRLIGIVADHPDCAAALRMLAAMRQMDGRNDLARWPAVRLTQLPEAEAFGWALLAMIEHEAARPRESLDAALRVLELDPDLSDVPVEPEVFWSDLTSDLILSGQASRAVDMLRNKLSSRGTPDALRAGLLEALGLSCEALGRAVEAESAWREAFRLDATRYRAALGLGQLALRVHENDEAQHWLELASRLDPEAPEPYYGLGQVHRRRGEVDKARAAEERHAELLKSRPRPGGMGYMPANSPGNR